MVVSTAFIFVSFFIHLHIYALVGSFGTTASGGGLANLAASLPFPPQGQLVADYIVESGAAGHGGSEQFGGAGGVTGSGVGGATYEEQQ